MLPDAPNSRDADSEASRGLIGIVAAVTLALRSNRLWEQRQQQPPGRACRDCQRSAGRFRPVSGSDCARPPTWCWEVIYVA